MPTSDLQTEISSSRMASDNAGRTNHPGEPEYQLTFIESSNVLVSLWRQIQERLREPKVTVPREYYRGEAKLPLTDVAPWYREFPVQIRTLFEKPQPLNVTSRPVDVPDIWQDYKQEPASWVNSLLVHGVVVAALVLPYFINRLINPPKAAATKVEYTDISPYLAQLPANAKKSGGGGGGGDRTPTPASKGALPKFAKEQLAPPLVKIPDVAKLQVQATLLGPPELKLPQMLPAQYGDPQGVVGAASNGPGTGGGIGSGNGTGIGSGDGGGLGPGSGGGTGGGAYSVGGNVTAPVAIYAPDPPYSEEARKAKYSGTVVVAIIVDAQGNVRDAQVVRALGLGLDEKAVETIRTWRFKPGMRNGVPVAVRVVVEVSFRLF